MSAPENTEARPSVKTLSHDDWIAEGKRLFGWPQDKWDFVCPVCGHRQTIAEMRAAEMPEGAMAFACIGRYRDDPRVARNLGKDAGAGCDYTSGGFLQFTPRIVVFPNGEKRRVFAFATGAREPRS